MKISKLMRARPLGLAAGATLAIGLATASPATAALTNSAQPDVRPAVLVPSGSASVANDTLTIVGTRDADIVSLSNPLASPALLQVEFGDDPITAKTFDTTTFTSINVLLGSGDDVLEEPSGVIGTDPMTVDGGSGNDTITTGAGNDIIFGGSGDDTIKSGDGNDQIFGDSGNDTVVGGRGADTALLGAGADTFVWNPGEGSDVVDGGSGVDELDFFGANVNENMSLSPNGTSAVFLRDVGNVRMDMSTVENLDVHTLGGADNVTINDMRGTSIRETSIDLSAQGVGDGQADLVTVNGSDRADNVSVAAPGSQIDVGGLKPLVHITGSEPALDKLQLNTLGANDTVDLDPNVSNLIGLGVDFGLGQH